MPRNLLVLISASLGFFFVTATTFTSLGYVLYTMVADLGWSQTAAGMSFSLLGLACGLASPLPPRLMKWFGTRATMVIGALVLGSGFLFAGLVQGIGLFFVATTLMGIGFSLIAPSPAVYLIATWFPDSSARSMGFYFMTGALGGVVGPLIVSTIVGLSGSWRLHWLCMAGASLALAVLFMVTIRDAVRVESMEQVKQAGAGGKDLVAPSAWSVSAALTSRTFLLIAFAMLVVQTVVTTIHSVLVTHIASFGGGSAPGALAMSLLALTGTLAKGVSGTFAEKVSPRLLLVGGIAVQCVAVGLLCVTTTAGWAAVWAMLFGLGWGFSWLSAHVLLLRYFGAAIAGELVAMATMATTFAVLGPLAAGWVADDTGSFVPVFAASAGLLALAVGTSLLFLRPPASAPRRKGDAASSELPEPSTLTVT